MGQQVGSMTPDEAVSYVAAWRKYKLLRNAVWAGCSLSFLLLGFGFRHHQDRTLVVLFGLCCIVLLPVGIAFQLWKCPRCGKAFSGGLIRVGWQQQPWIRRCYWCELSKSELGALERQSPGSSSRAG
jgi:hypothetical protein